MGATSKSEEEIMKEKMKKRAFINEKLQNSESSSGTGNK
jgi:hypothetical protein